MQHALRQILKYRTKSPALCDIQNTSQISDFGSEMSGKSKHVVNVNRYYSPLQNDKNKISGSKTDTYRQTDTEIERDRDRRETE